jgi:hypothetical protein
MGLAEQLREGAILERKNITFSGTDTGSVFLGATYSILDIEVDSPCRIRFYDTENSLDDFAESIREYDDSPSATDIALIGDISMSIAGKYTMDPVLYGVPEDTIDYLTYFRITDSLADVTVSLSVYILEDENIVADEENSFYKTPNRKTLEFIGTEDILTGVPRTYLMISASTDENCRLRIYADSISRDDSAEIGRTFSEAVVDPENKIIADMELEAGEVTKFYPKIIGANLETLPRTPQNLPGNIETIRLNRNSINSRSEIYYRLEPSSAKVNLDVYTLEN